MHRISVTYVDGNSMKQWFSNRARGGGDFHPQGTRHNWRGCYWHVVGRGYWHAKYLIMHRQAPTEKELSKLMKIIEYNTILGYFNTFFKQVVLG